MQYLLDVDDTLSIIMNMPMMPLAESLKKGDIDQFNTLIHNASAQPLSPGMHRVLRTFKKYNEYITHTLEYPTLTMGQSKASTTVTKH